jgi:hypothetical protein
MHVGIPCTLTEERKLADVVVIVTRHLYIIHKRNNGPMTDIEAYKGSLCKRSLSIAVHNEGRDLECPCPVHV